jgi:hypothetical protein
MDKENATTDIGAMKGFLGAGRPMTRDKKSRSKSLGPGGLDALQSMSGNRRKVFTFLCYTDEKDSVLQYSNTCMIVYNGAPSEVYPQTYSTGVTPPEHPNI